MACRRSTKLAVQRLLCVQVMDTRAFKPALLKFSKLIVATSIAVSSASPVAFAGSNSSEQKDWTLHKTKLSRSVKVRSKKARAGVASTSAPVDVITLDSQTEIEIPSGFETAAVQRNEITADEAREIESIRHEILETTLQASLSENFNGTLIASNSEAYSIAPNSNVVNGDYQRSFNPVLSVLSASESNPAEQVPRSKFLARIKAFGRFLNEAIFISTAREFRNHRKQLKEVSPKADEIGLSLNFKVELQLGVGSFNFSRNGGVVLDVGYNRKTHLVSLRTGIRREQLGDGIGLPGVKFEVRRYKSISGIGKENPVSIGHAWYPPGVPGLSVVVDSSDRYIAHGLAFGAGADIVLVGTFLLNAVNEFRETEKRVTLFRVPDQVFKIYRDMVDLLLFRPRTCRAVFG